MKRLALTTLLLSACSENGNAPRGTDGTTTDPGTVAVTGDIETGDVSQTGVTTGSTSTGTAGDTSTGGFNGAQMAKELIRLGGDLRDAQRDLRDAKRDQRDAKRELAKASAPVFFLECLERRTGKTVDGDIIERHIRRNTKDAQACKAKYTEMSELERADFVIAWVTKQEAP